MGIGTARLTRPANADLKKIKDKNEGFGNPDIFEPVFCSSIKEERVPLMKGEDLVLHLVFDIAFEDVFAFVGVGADQLLPAGILLQFQQDDVGGLRTHAAGKDTFIGKSLYRFFCEELLLALPDNEHTIIADAVVHVFEEAAEVFLQRVDNVKENGKGGNSTVVLDLGDQTFANAGLLGQLFKGNILLGPFGLYLISKQQEEFFMHMAFDSLQLDSVQFCRKISKLRLRQKISRSMGTQVCRQIGDMIRVEIIHLQLHQLMPGNRKVGGIPQPYRQVQGMRTGYSVFECF